MLPLRLSLLLVPGLSDLKSLPVADILCRLLETEGGQGQPSAVLGSKHLISWGFEDQLAVSAPPADPTIKDVKDAVEKDKDKVVVLGRVSLNLGRGCMVHSGSIQPLKVIPKPTWMAESGPCTTLAFSSDGTHFYWVWCPATVADKTAKGISIYVSSFKLDEATLEVHFHLDRVTLTRKEEAGNHRANETLMNRLRPLRGSSSAATLAALIGSEAPAKKEENVAAGSTSCGVLLKTLMKAPIYCDGSSVVILVPLPGGACFDVHNNLIWLCSSDYIDQFYNPGHQAPHHIHQQLGIKRPLLPTQDSGDYVSMQEVVGALLQHIGSMCLHQLHSDVLQWPMGSYVLQQHPLIFKVSVFKWDREGEEEQIKQTRLADDLVNYILKLAVKDSCVLLSQAQSCSSDQKAFDALLCNVPDLQTAVLNLSSRIISGASEVLESFLETCAAMVSAGREDSGLERLAKATVLGWLLPALLTALTHPNLYSLNLADALMPSLVRLILLSSQAALMLKRHQNSVPEDELDLGGTTTVETIHPVRDNYKFKETVHIPGARCLYLRFDPRCSSQYDYDKLIIYAGPNTSAKKVAEYGGNTFGFGSRSVLGSGWPKDLVKECAEEVSGGLPFLSDLALSLSVLACTMLALLYDGPPISPEESTCQHLLRSKLLQSPVLPRIKLPVEILTHLRKLAKRQTPRLRPSIKLLKHKELAMLCFLKDVQLDRASLEITVKTLMERFEADVQAWQDKVEEEEMKKTKHVVRGILSRLSLLLHVNITPMQGSLSLARTVSHLQGFHQEKRKTMSILQDLLEDESDDKPAYITLIDQLFAFIGSDPEKALVPLFVNRLLSTIMSFTASQVEDLEHSGLARQVSTLLTHHLARATNAIGNAAGGTEALQEVTQTVDTAVCAGARWAKAILSQPACVSKLLSLLLDRGDQVMLSSRTPSPGKLHTQPDHQRRHQRGEREDSDVQGGRISVFLHKREDQMSHDVIQPLLSSDNRPFRLAGGANMEKVVRMDRELSKHGKCEVTTEEAMVALKKAYKTDPVRAFISGHVANTMAAEVIALLHNLLTAPRDQHGTDVGRSGCSGFCLMSTAKLANAALASLGAFHETVKPGCAVKVIGEGVHHTQGTVQSVSEQTDQVTIELDKGDEEFQAARYASSIRVPITRVVPMRNEIFQQCHNQMSESVISAVQAAILPGDETASSPLQQSLGTVTGTDGNSLAHQVCRVTAEIQSRAAMVLALYMRNVDFSTLFISKCGASLDMLKTLAKDCSTDSDSEGNETGGAGSVAESRDNRTPPRAPCKTAVAPSAMKEYDGSQCLHYNRLLSYDNFVLTGPESQLQPVAEERFLTRSRWWMTSALEDHYALLVKAWEQRVFPVIRRRFRNEAERKDGLEQIRGPFSLTSGRDLAKFTIERVKKGTTVIIRTPSSLSSSTGAALLPKFAVRAHAQDVRSLTGTVLDLDTPNELVQVETYLRSEGVLVRFWYPLEMLEKPQPGLRKSSITGGQTMDTSNVHIHRELLQSEAGLARMYVRMAFLRLINHCNSPAMDTELLSSMAATATNSFSGMAACAATLQELDLENLLLLSTDLLAPPLPDGTLVAMTPAVAPLSPRQCLAPILCSFTGLVYRHGDRLQRELATAIARAAQQGEDYLIELTSQLCMCLQTAPEMFPSEEFPVTEVKVNTDVHFPGAACLLVSCRIDPKTGKKDSSPYKSPWARIYTYTGKRIKKSGQVTRQEVVSYPRDTTTTSTQSDQYTPTILPADLAHVRLGVSPPPGIILTIHGLPPQFLLALAYIETLLTEKFGCGMKGCGDRRSGMDGLMKFLGADMPESEDAELPPNVPALLKEYVFFLLAQAVRILHYCQGHGATALSKLSPRFSPTQGVFQALLRELKVLYDEEVKDMPLGTTPSGAGVGIGVTDHGRFSAYFQAAFEAGLAVADVIPVEMPPLKSASAAGGDDGGDVTAPTLSPSAPAKKKKLKTKPSSVAGVPSGISISSSATSLKLEEIPWFQRAIVVSRVLRYLALGEDHCATDFDNFVHNAAVSTQSPTAHSRIVIVSGIPAHVQPEVVRSALQKVCGSHGGIENNEVYVPEITLHHVKQKSTRIPSVSFEMDSTAATNASASLPAPQESRETEQEAASKAEEKPTTAAQAPPGRQHSSQPQPCTQGFAVFSLPSKTKVESVRKALYRSKALMESLQLGGGLEQPDAPPDDSFTFSVVNSSLLTDPEANQALEQYLIYKLFGTSREFTDEASQALTEVFYSCFFIDQQNSSPDSRQETGYICLGRDQILHSVPENLLLTFFQNSRPVKKPISDHVTWVLKQYGMIKSTDKDTSPPSDKGSGRSRLKKVTSKSSKEKVVLGQTQISEKGQGEKCAYLDMGQAVTMMRMWSLEMDVALVTLVNELCRSMAVASSRLHAHELLLTDVHLASQQYACLQNQPPESIRLRFAFLQNLNNILETFFLPLVDLRPAAVFSRSTASVLSKLRAIIFFDSKSNFINRILNATAKRKPDQAAPEITLDPLESIGVDRRGCENTIYCQAYRQLVSVSSRQLCVRLASGGDPTYAFNVRMTGEEVHGGSFRQFLWQVAKELQGSTLGLLLPAPSAASGVSKGKSLFKPGPMTYSEENLLLFLGQVETESELQALCGDVFPRFVYTSLDGQEVELIPNGQHIAVSLSNRHQYVEAVRQLRLRELTNKSRLMAIGVGLATVFPRQLLGLLSPFDMELRTSGLPVVDLTFLKAHTMYQVGLMETDTHIEYFWAALETLSQEELSRFIKFACNQERIPQTCPCRTPDARYIRVETCMFMIKLPQYSSYEIMLQRLRYAINCREDPLSG
nr:hypothetical protein BaRGS_007655 [Batillaria attramentaria]